MSKKKADTAKTKKKETVAAATRYEMYAAARGAERTEADLRAVVSPFTIQVRFLGGLTAAQQNAFRTAANRWTAVITGDLPSINVDGEVIDDILILAQGKKIDGPGKILGQAGPTHVRPANAPSGRLLPAKGIMSFDTADLAQMEADGSLNDVITHEMGHVLGIGTMWEDLGLLNGGGSPNPTFRGARSMEEYARLRGMDGSVPVPVESEGGPGTADGHWRETVFGSELMTGYVDVAPNPMSRLTVVCLSDMGYQVNPAAAEPYQLPDLQALAEGGHLRAHSAPVDRGIMFRSIPIELPEDSLQ